MYRITFWNIFIQTRVYVSFFLMTVVLLFLGVGCEKPAVDNQTIMMNKTILSDGEKEENNDLNLKIFTSKKFGFQFQYPIFLSLSSTDDGISLLHSVPFEHQDSCDFKGDAPLLRNIVDFNLFFKMYNHNLEETIAQSKWFYLNQYLLNSNAFKLEEPFIEFFQINFLSGYRVYTGSHGCGAYLYFIPLSPKKTLLIVRSYIPEFQFIFGMREKYLQVSGVILPEKEEKIFNELMNSFQLYDHSK